MKYCYKCSSHKSCDLQNLLEDYGIKYDTEINVAEFCIYYNGTSYQKVLKKINKSVDKTR